MIFADTPTLGILIGLPVTLLIVGACCFVMWLARGWREDEYGDIGIAFFCAAGVALLTLIICAVAMWPWKYQYHFWQPVEGRVQEISKRLVSNGDDGMSEKFVVVIDGQPYGVNDTRAALVREGDFLSIRCKRAYEWGSPNNGWDCRWGGVR